MIPAAAAGRGCRALQPPCPGSAGSAGSAGSPGSPGSPGALQPLLLQAPPADALLVLRCPANLWPSCFPWSPSPAALPSASLRSLCSSSSLPPCSLLPLCSSLLLLPLCSSPSAPLCCRSALPLLSLPLFFFSEAEPRIS